MAPCRVRQVRTRLSERIPTTGSTEAATSRPGSSPSCSLRRCGRPSGHSGSRPRSGGASPARRPPDPGKSACSDGAGMPIPATCTPRTNPPPEPATAGGLDPIQLSRRRDTEWPMSCGKVRVVGRGPRSRTHCARTTSVATRTGPDTAWARSGTEPPRQRRISYRKCRNRPSQLIPTGPPATTPRSSPRRFRIAAHSMTNRRPGARSAARSGRDPVAGDARQAPSAPQRRRQPVRRPVRAGHLGGTAGPAGRERPRRASGQVRASKAAA